MNYGFKKNSKPEVEYEDDENTVIENKFDIRVVGNTIYFYEDVYDSQILELKEKLTKLSFELNNTAYQMNYDPVIELHIYSAGGDVFMGLSMYDFIKNSRIPIHTHIDGMIASSATFIYLAGHRRFMTSNAMVLIHQLSTTFWGKFEDLKDEFTNSSEIMKIIQNIYSDNTTMTKKALKGLLKRELYLDYNACKKINFTTE